MSGSVASRFYKDSTRKQSQANQKRKHQADDQVNMSQHIDNGTLNANSFSNPANIATNAVSAAANSQSI